MWLVSLALAAPGLALPPGQDPRAWSSAARLAGIEIGCGEGPCVYVAVTPTTWELRVGTRHGSIAPPVDERGRAAVAWLAASLTRPLPEVAVAPAPEAPKTEGKGAVPSRRPRTVPRLPPSSGVPVSVQAPAPLVAPVEPPPGSVAAETPVAGTVVRASAEARPPPPSVVSEPAVALAEPLTPSPESPAGVPGTPDPASPDTLPQPLDPPPSVVSGPAVAAPPGSPSRAPHPPVSQPPVVAPADPSPPSTSRPPVRPWVDLRVAGGATLQPTLTPNAVGAIAVTIGLERWSLEIGSEIGTRAGFAELGPRWTQARQDLLAGVRFRPVSWLGVGIGGGASRREWSQDGEFLAATWVPVVDGALDARVPGRVVDGVLRLRPAFDLRSVAVALDGEPRGRLSPLGFSVTAGVVVHPLR